MNRTKKEAKAYRADLNKSLLHHMHRAKAFSARIDGFQVALDKALKEERWVDAREITRSIQGDSLSARVALSNLLTNERKLSELDREEAAARVTEVMG